MGAADLLNVTREMWPVGWSVARATGQVCPIIALERPRAFRPRSPVRRLICPAITRCVVHQLLRGCAGRAPRSAQDWRRAGMVVVGAVAMTFSSPAHGLQTYAIE